MGSEPERDLLFRRLELLGLHGVSTIQTHTNRIVMVSRSSTGVLRLHRGYAHAPDRVLAAIVRFVRPGARRSTRRAAEAVLLGFPVERYAPPAPRPAPEEALDPADRRLVEELQRLHESLNRQHFGGRLGPLPIRLSTRMRRRLGEVRLERGSGRALEIVLSRRHCRDPWGEVTHTLLHEMVHQWQAESGLRVDHGIAFRRKAREVGIDDRAVSRADVGRAAAALMRGAP
jgi:hypothetical protein